MFELFQCFYRIFKKTIRFCDFHFAPPARGGSDDGGDGSADARLAEELREAARLLRLGEIVARHRVSRFDVLQPAHARRLLRHIVAQLHAPTVLADAMHVAEAYTHLSLRAAVVEYLLGQGADPNAATGGGRAAPEVRLRGAWIILELSAFKTQNAKRAF